ncbi:MAG: tetratricopeptide repeat protein [Flavobacteriales bacterium]|nr:tetratricopeptide repeat protein [Flavobacteriales bacterium]
MILKVHWRSSLSALVGLACAACTSAQEFSGQRAVDSLQAVIDTTTIDSLRLAALLDVAFAQHSIDPRAGVKAGEEAYALAIRREDLMSEAKANAVLGMCRLSLGDHVLALQYQLKALDLFERLDDRHHIGTAHNNIGILYREIGEFEKANEHLEFWYAIAAGIPDSMGIATASYNLGTVKASQGAFDEALERYYGSLAIARAMGTHPRLVLENLIAIGILLTEKKADHDRALQYAFEALALNREYHFGEAQAMAYLLAGEAYRGSAMAGSDQASEPLLTLSRSYLDSAVHTSKAGGFLVLEYASHKELSEVLALLGEPIGALESFRAYSTLKDSAFNLEKDKKIVQNTMQYEFDKKQAQARAEQEKKDIRQRLVRNAIIAGLVGVSIFLIVVYKQRNRIGKEKERSERLLLNILPSEVAAELKAKGSAEAVHLDQVTVLFTDFKGFTAMSEQLSPKDLVKDLHECFSAFDRITEKYSIEKIKTIGDAYMAAGGLPTPNTTHATDVIKAAFEMRDFIAEGKARKVAAGLPYFEIRIGIHTGPVVAGIVGVKKFSYDIWGDTVNTASRMESSGEAGQVNISEATYELAKDEPGLSFTPRGKVQAKGKGEMEMYFAGTK